MVTIADERHNGVDWQPICHRVGLHLIGFRRNPHKAAVRCRPHITASHGQVADGDVLHAFLAGFGDLTVVIHLAHHQSVGRSEVKMTVHQRQGIDVWVADNFSPFFPFAAIWSVIHGLTRCGVVIVEAQAHRGNPVAPFLFGWAHLEYLVDVGRSF